mmetsp:Transcript_25944/g.72387  ORF Transcript_25944/g.72387 Transcript_25944/m.72387 type:complete len:221 (-) Transcript_25944:774-1436(-)
MPLWMFAVAPRRKVWTRDVAAAQAACQSLTKTLSHARPAQRCTSRNLWIPPAAKRAVKAQPERAENHAARCAQCRGRPTRCLAVSRWRAVCRIVIWGPRRASRIPSSTERRPTKKLATPRSTTKRTSDSTRSPSIQRSSARSRVPINSIARGGDGRGTCFWICSVAQRRIGGLWPLASIWPSAAATRRERTSISPPGSRRLRLVPTSTRPEARAARPPPA